ncbi:hypothetical protein PORY_001556 [Pneumocystis oryctolagi]|uniref:Uncharacterized protein n=1 Tax=Pneumocystis oryctolagi TaxID=42067 RepID=A0ACB7CB95_9ASCO|nr:hypothetical protein PORY_001556 [Pneumocystis oryctolagi]
MIDLSVIAWRMPEWVSAYGGLRTENVLEYFSQSPFYDRHSNNQLLKMQTQFNTLGDLQGHLKKMRGIEFIISADYDPDAWIIYKQHRTSEHDASVLAAYFVANESIYMAPSIHAIVASRMLNIILSLRLARSSVYGLYQFSPMTGYSYASTHLKETPVHDKSDQHMFKALMDTMRERHTLMQHKDTLESKQAENQTQIKPKQNEIATASKKKRKTDKKRKSPVSP